MVKLLGIFDLIVVMMLLAIAFNVEIPTGLSILIPVILMLKAFSSLAMGVEGFIGSIGGLIDFGVVVVLVLSFFMTLPWIVLLITIILIGQKGIVSLFTP